MIPLSVVPLAALKLAAYSAWCWLGLRWLTSRPPTVPRAIRLGLLRVGIGLPLGWGLVFLLTFAAPDQNRLGVSIPALLGGVAVLRWLEWCLVGAVAVGSGWTVSSVVGSGPRQQLWRAGGVLLSFATDVGIVSGVAALGLVPC